MKRKSYIEQAAEIESLCKSISEKAKRFSERKHQSPYFEDLLYLINELKDINEFIEPSPSNRT